MKKNNKQTVELSQKTINAIAKAVAAEMKKPKTIFLSWDHIKLEPIPSLNLS